MGVYACFLISLLLLIFQTISNASSVEYVASKSNQSINSLPLQQHHQVLVSPREDGGGGGSGSGGEENRTASEWAVLRAKGGKSGGVGSNINHKPGKQKNAASNLVNSKITLLPIILLLTSYFYIF